MPWGDKTKAGLEGWFTQPPAPGKPSWSDRIGDWFFNALARGGTKMLEDIEPGAIDGMKEMLVKLRDDPNVPDDMKALIDKTLTPGNPALVILGVLLVFLMMTGMLNAIFAPLNRAIEYKVDRLVESYRMDPMSIITAWRRDPVKYAFLLDDLLEQGWSPPKVEALKFFTQFMPSAQDLVNWQAKEVFEPAMIAKYGLDDEFAGLDLTLFAKIGVTEPQARNYWRAHWEHASWDQVVEMVRRGQMTEPDVWDWFRLVEIPPFWRDKLIAISWAVPTRVDIRRFYDLKTIDEARLRELYTAQGYHGKDLDDYVLWTKIYVELPDLLARWKNGWITLDEVRSRLIADGMNPDAADELIQTKVKSVEPTSTAEGKELTKTEIYKGVKQNILTYDQGIELLIDLDYTSDQAEYLLTTNVAVLAGSPETLPEYKDLTQKYRRAAGLESKAVPYELKQAALELVRATKERDRLQEAVDQEKAKLIPGEVLPTEATVRLKELEVALHRAESEVARIKQHYEAQMAEYKHGG